MRKKSPKQTRPKVVCKPWPFLDGESPQSLVKSIIFSRTTTQHQSRSRRISNAREKEIMLFMISWCCEFQVCGSVTLLIRCHFIHCMDDKMEIKIFEIVTEILMFLLGVFRYFNDILWCLSHFQVNGCIVDSTSRHTEGPTSSSLIRSQSVTINLIWNINCLCPTYLIW